jgi:hypothetical protein
VVVIAHSAQAFGLLFILNRLVCRKLLPGFFIINGQKIICLNVENITFLDSLNYLAMPLRNLSEAFGLTARKSWYPHFFDTTDNMNHECPATDVSCYGTNRMHESVRIEFSVWHEFVAKKEVFENRRVLERYCQANITLLQEGCHTIHKHFLQIGNVEVFLEKMTIASPFNKVFRKKFIQLDRKGLIPVGPTLTIEIKLRKLSPDCYLKRRKRARGYCMEKIQERLFPELPVIGTDGLCEETRTVYEFNGCY